MSLLVSVQAQRGDWSLQLEHQFEPGVTAIMGQSGAGKSTLLRCIAGLEAGSHGKIQFENQALDRLPAHKRGLGYLIQDAALFPHMSVADNLGFARQHGSSALSAKAEKRLLNKLGIAELLQRKPGELSGGQQRRVSLARALVGGAQCLLLDEPCNSLDQSSRLSFLHYLNRLKQAHPLTILYVSHDLREAAAIADQVLEIEQGRASACGPINDWLCRSPQATQAQALSAWDLSIADYQATDQILNFDTGTQCLQIPSAAPDQASARLLIPADAVSLEALSEQSTSSVRNHLAVEIIDKFDSRPGELCLVLKHNGHRLLARITRQAAKELNLQIGQQAQAAIKATAIRAF